MRHKLANGLYRLARRLDRPVKGFNGGLDFGQQKDWNAPGVHSHTNIHLRDDVRIGGHFEPGRYTSAWLELGDGQEYTVHLTRKTAHRVRAMCEQIDTAFGQYGESTYP